MRMWRKIVQKNATASPTPEYTPIHLLAMPSPMNSPDSAKSGRNFFTGRRTMSRCMKRSMNSQLKRMNSTG